MVSFFSFRFEMSTSLGPMRSFSPSLSSRLSAYSGPNRSAKAACASSSRVGPWKISTALASMAAWISAKVSSLMGWDRSMS